MIDWPEVQPLLPAEGLVLRPLQPLDAEPMYRYLQDPACVEFTTILLPFELADAVARVDAAAAGFRAHTLMEFAITEAGGEILGTSVLYNFRDFDHVCEIGYILAPAARGRGFASRAVRRLSDYAFELGIRRVQAMVDEANPKSVRVMELSGFTLEAVMRNALTRRDGSQTDGLLFAKLP